MRPFRSCDYGTRTTPPSPANARYMHGRGVTPLQPGCPRDYFFWSTIIVLWVTIAAVLIIMSMAAASRYYHERTDDVAKEAVMEHVETLKRTNSQLASRPSSPGAADDTPRAAAAGMKSSGVAEEDDKQQLLKALAGVQEALAALTSKMAAAPAGTAKR